MTEKENKLFMHELGLIKNLLAHILVGGKAQSEAISILKRVGFEQKEIAEALDTTSNTVNVTLYKAKKKKK